MSLRPADIDGMREALGRIRDSQGGGRDIPFARVAGAVFDEIESLRSERFSLIDICRALEAEGYLPKGSNPRSLSKAMCRERERRNSSGVAKTGDKKLTAGIASGEKPQVVPRSATKANVSPEYKMGAATGTRLKPGNLFDIEMLDLSGLPEL